MTPTRILAILLFTLLGTACQRSQPLPTSPSPTFPTNGLTLSGVVYESTTSGRRALAGAGIAEASQNALADIGDLVGGAILMRDERLGQIRAALDAGSSTHDEAVRVETIASARRRCRRLAAPVA
jgi:hypothetical protein